MKPEADFKTKLVKAVRVDGGYARRVEDQFGVGMPDMTLAVRGARKVWMAEAKIVRAAYFGPTERQLVELRRIEECANEFVGGLMLGFDPRTVRYYYGTPAARLYLEHTMYAETLSELIERIRSL